MFLKRFVEIDRWSIDRLAFEFFLLVFLLARSARLSFSPRGSEEDVETVSMAKEKKEPEGSNGCFPLPRAWRFSSLFLFLLSLSLESGKKKKRMEKKIHLRPSLPFDIFFSRLPLPPFSSPPSSRRHACRRDRRLARQRHGALLEAPTGRTAPAGAPTRALGDDDASSLSVVVVLISRRCCSATTMLQSFAPRRPRLGLLRLPVQLPVQGVGLDPHRRQAYGGEHQGPDARDKEGAAGGRRAFFFFFFL